MFLREARSVFFPGYRDGNSAACRRFQKVVRHGRISTDYPIENPIKGNLRVRIAVLARFNQPLSLPYHRTLNENDNLFLGSWVKEVAHGAGSLAPERDACTRIHCGGRTAFT